MDEIMAMFYRVQERAHEGGHIMGYEDIAEPFLAVLVEIAKQLKKHNQNMDKIEETLYRKSQGE